MQAAVDQVCLLMQEQASDVHQLRNAHEAVAAACAHACTFGSDLQVQAATNHAHQAILGLCSAMSDLLK